MEELQATHRKQLKDLQSRITQKKKQATKKTRKGVNDECDNLERQLKEQQAAEMQALSDPNGLSENIDTLSINDGESDDKQQDNQEETNPLARTPSQPITIPSQPQPQPGTTPLQTSPIANTPPTSDSAPKRKPNRARERLARRLAEQEALFASAEKESSLLPNQKAIEREAMLSEFSKRSLTEKEIRADGHCLYSAVADQLQEMNIPLSAQPGAKSRISFLAKREDAGREEQPYRVVRKAAAAYIEAHADDFAPFLEEPLEDYVRKVADTGEWGGQLELLALARTYNVPISVLQGDGRVEDILPEHEGDAEKKIWLAYYKHGFGLGEHYNSLHKAR